MLNYYADVAPEKHLRECYVWAAYAKEFPWLPVAVADSAEALVAKVGTSKNSVMSTWSRYRSGKLKHSRYHRVLVGYDPPI